MLEHMKTHHIDISKYVNNPDDYVFATDILTEKDRMYGSKVKSYREKEDLSRREAAIQLGITPKELKAIENSDTLVDKKLAIKMAMVFNVPLFLLLN